MVYKFNIPTTLVPAGSTISYATLSLTTFDYGSGAFLTKPANGNIAWYKITSNWAEATLTNNNRPTASNTVVVQGVAKQPENGWETWNITSAVRDWVNNPSTNFGIQGSITNEFQKHGYRSSEFATADARPKLTITFEPSSSVRAARTAEQAARMLSVRTVDGAGLVLSARTVAGGSYRLTLCDLRGAKVWSASGVSVDGAVSVDVCAQVAAGSSVAILDLADGSRQTALIPSAR